jgi:hypothetical protein
MHGVRSDLDAVTERIADTLVPKLRCNKRNAHIEMLPKAIRGFEPITRIYRGVLLSALLHAILYVVHTICSMHYYRLQIKWDYKGKK